MNIAKPVYVCVFIFFLQITWGKKSIFLHVNYSVEFLEFRNLEGNYEFGFLNFIYAPSSKLVKSTYYLMLSESVDGDKYFCTQQQY